MLRRALWLLLGVTACSPPSREVALTPWLTAHVGPVRMWTWRGPEDTRDEKAELVMRGGLFGVRRVETQGVLFLALFDDPGGTRRALVEDATPADTGSFLLLAEGRRPVRLTAPACQQGHVALSPDGDRLVCTRCLDPAAEPPGRSPAQQWRWALTLRCSEQLEVTVLEPDGSHRSTAVVHVPRPASGAVRTVRHVGFLADGRLLYKSLVFWEDRKREDHHTGLLAVDARGQVQELAAPGPEWREGCNGDIDWTRLPPPLTARQQVELHPLHPVPHHLAMCGLY